MRSIPVKDWMDTLSDMKISNLYGIFKLRMYTESKALRRSFEAKNLFFKIFIMM